MHISRYQTRSLSLIPAGQRIDTVADMLETQEIEEKEVEHQVEYEEE